MTTNTGAVDGAALLDDDLDTALTVRPPEGGAPAWIQLVFAEPVTVRAVSLASRGPGVPFGRVLAGDDAAHLRTILTLPGAQQYRSSLARGRRVVLSLGDVRDLAEVVVNGTTMPLVWKAPLDVDVTRALHAGTNQVEIRVTNEWTNRLIGDRAAPPEKTILSSAPAFFGGTPPLPLAGLLGPISFVAIESK